MRTVTLIALAGCLIAGPVWAQEGPQRKGFWIGFGLGGGVNVSEGLDGGRLGGGAAYLRLGGTPSPNVLVGFESIGWGRRRNGLTLGRANATATVLLYPSAERGTFVKLGVGGASVATVDDSGPTTITQTAEGFGATVGVGVDVRLGRVELTPNLDWLFQAFDSNDFPTFSSLPGTNSILLFTLGLTWH